MCLRRDKSHQGTLGNSSWVFQCVVTLTTMLTAYSCVVFIRSSNGLSPHHFTTVTFSHDCLDVSLFAILQPYYFGKRMDTGQMIFVRAECEGSTVSLQNRIGECAIRSSCWDAMSYSLRNSVLQAVAQHESLLFKVFVLTLLQHAGSPAHWVFSLKA
jgi:hypothetical protein